MDIKRIVIAVGGTGGHLYPAQALAQQLLKCSPNVELLFIGGGLSKNTYFNQKDFAFEDIACSALVSKHPVRILKGGLKLLQGFWQSRQILQRASVDVIVGFGSYYAVAPLLAAYTLSIPIVLHEANSVPGKANRWLAPLATAIGTHFPEAATCFNRKCIQIDIPLREGYELVHADKERAAIYYGLSATESTLLICGGSQGAHAINKCVRNCLVTFQKLGLQIVHLTGSDEMTHILANLYRTHNIAACVKTFEHRMEMAWSLCSSFMGRCGASTIAEAVEFEVPGLLIPYPYATEAHQEKNSRFFVEHLHAGLMLKESDLTNQNLTENLHRLYQLAPIFRNALKNYKQRPQKHSLCELILNINQLKGK